MQHREEEIMVLGHTPHFCCYQLGMKIIENFHPTSRHGHIITASSFSSLRNAFGQYVSRQKMTPTSSSL